jgi:hypothetical protein
VQNLTKKRVVKNGFWWEEKERVKIKLENGKSNFV